MDVFSHHAYNFIVRGRIDGVFVFLPAHVLGSLNVFLAHSCLLCHWSECAFDQLECMKFSIGI